VTVTHVAPNPLPQGPRDAGRQPWIDNLRVAVIAGVIVHHVATAYVLDVDWYYQERTSNPATEVAVAAVILPASLFAMAVLFLLAGLLAQRSLARSGAGRFLRRRLLRLGVPLVVYTFLIGPATSVVGARAEGDPAAADVRSLFINELREIDTGPLWFVAALLVFSVAYAAWRSVRPSPGAPAPLRRSHLAVAAAAILVGSFAVRLVWPFASDSPFNLNLWEWPQTATLFALGVLAGERSWLDPVPHWIPRTCGRATAAALVAIGVLVAAVSLADDTDRFTGGWRVQALAEPLVEGTMAVAMSFWMLVWFMRRADHDGPLARRLGRASFAAYILHAPLVVLLSAGLSSVAMVIEFKFLVVAVLGVISSFTVGWSATRVRPLAGLL
jgi:glucan biosynthesis protein C